MKIECITKKEMKKVIKSLDNRDWKKRFTFANPYVERIEFPNGEEITFTVSKSQKE